MISFGLVTEGVTDQEILTSILCGYYENPNLLFNELQPLRDETDRDKSQAGWGNLLEYCRSEVFKNAFQTNAYVIVQIDTDVSEEYGVSKNENGEELSPERLIEKVIDRFKEIIGIDFYEKCQNRIIFAISVHSIECWLLPIYYTDNRKSKIVNCLETLNKELAKKEGFTIDSKNLEYYEQIAKVFLKKKNLNKYYPHNPSFAIFIQKLGEMNISVIEK